LAKCFFKGFKNHIKCGKIKVVLNDFLRAWNGI